MLSRDTFETFKTFFRGKLSGADALPQLAILGLLVGALTAALILLFRFLIEWPLAYFLPGGDPENFEGLSRYARAILPLSGAIVIAVIWHQLRISQRKVGIAFVMERLNYHQGYINFKSLMTQFIGGILVLVSGQSSGREGPAVHIGAACSSILGKYFALPNNSIRTLVGCGTAAAIAASFNTPIAGVIFAMEVVMMEYTIAGFTPVILASVSAALLSQVVYGADPAFLVPQLFMNSLLEVPFIILCGVVIGLASAAFVRLLKATLGFNRIAISYRILLAGLVTALIAQLYPQVMGIGYDTVNHALLGQYGVLLLCGIALCKIIVTAVTVGLGMPNGLVSPTLVIGATIGGAMGLIAQWLMPSVSSSPGFYAMLGMGAMMGSVLQAPLAALMALLELTQNPNIILPGMLIIVISSMFASEVFRQKSVFVTILEHQGLSYHNGPVTQALRRVSVGAIMERKFTQADKVISVEQAHDLLRQEPKWILINGSDGLPNTLLPSVDLAKFLEEHEHRFIEAENDPLQERMLIDLVEIPAQRQEISPIYVQATLQEALDHFNEAKTDALYVERTRSSLMKNTPMIKSVVGVMMRSDVENYYQYKRS